MANSLNGKSDQSFTSATLRAQSPASFPIGSIESRAAARVISDELEANDGPQEGDIFIDFKNTPEGVELFRRFRSSRNTHGPTIGRIPGVPQLWLRFPKGFDPDAFPETSTVILPSEHSVARVGTYGPNLSERLTAASEAVR